MNLSQILADIEATLAVAKAIKLPAQGEAAVELADAIEGIIKGGYAAYEAHQGEPYDLSQLTDEEEI